MSFKEKVNRIRGTIMHALTKQIGRSDSIRGATILRIDNVLICRPNSRLGNQILITPIIQEITNDFPDCRIDLFVRGELAPVIFKNYQHIDQIIRLPQKPFKNIVRYLVIWYKLRRKNYDLVINIDNGSSSGKLSTYFAKSKRKIYGVPDAKLLSLHNDYMHLAKNPVYNLRKFVDAGIGKAKSDVPIPLLSIMLNADEKIRGKERLSQLVKNNNKTICIYTYATGAKCYPVEWWNHLYELILKIYGNNYNILEILPKENVSQINFKALSFYSTDIREIAALISNTTLFIGADSGIMHLASSSGIPTIGLFSISSLNRYQPYGKRNVAINTNDKSFEDIIHIIDIYLTS